MLFQLVPGGFSYLIINQNNKNSNWTKLLGFRNMQERVENSIQCIWLFDPVLCNSTNWTNVLLILGERKLGT